MNIDEKDAQIARELKPCRHMARLVDSLADESLHGVARWYVELHIKSCRQCYSTFVSIRKACEQLQVLRNKEVPVNLSAESQSSLASLLDDVEKRRQK